MSSEETTKYVANTAALLKLDIKPEWMPNVVRFFEIAQTMAADVVGSKALTEAEAAPVFVPREKA
jgi:hypothetical protein